MHKKGQANKIQGRLIGQTERATRKCQLKPRTPELNMEQKRNSTKVLAQVSIIKSQTQKMTRKKIHEDHDKMCRCKHTGAKARTDLFSKKLTHNRHTLSLHDPNIQPLSGPSPKANIWFISMNPVL